MTQEEKAKAYDEALKRAKKLNADNMMSDEAIEEIFPELRESEDERIRKDLIKYLESDRDCQPCQNVSFYDRSIAWLEKQGEQKPNLSNSVGSEQKPIPPFDELTPDEKMNHPLYLEGFDVGRAVQKVFNEQKWSEEDESYLQTVINEMEANKKEARESEHKKYDTIISWLKSLRPHLKQEQPDVDLEKTVEFECIGKKVKMTVQELINYYIDSECADVADECGF